MRSLSIVFLALASLAVAHGGPPRPSGVPSNPDFQPWCCPRTSGDMPLTEQSFENGKVYCTYADRDSNDVECKYNRFTGDKARRERRHNNDESRCPCHATLNPALESKLPSPIRRHNRDSDECDIGGGVNNPLRAIINNSDKDLEPCPAPEPPQQCLAKGAECPIEDPGRCCSQTCSVRDGCV